MAKPLIDLHYYTLELSIEGGQLGSTEIELCDTEDALLSKDDLLDTIYDWVIEGDWDPKGAIVPVDYILWTNKIDEDGYIIDHGTVEIHLEPDHEALIKLAVSEAGYTCQCNNVLNCEHNWSRENEGGCNENPGVYSTGGTTIIINEHCTKCGLHRAWTRYGSQRNPGQSDLVDYKYEPERGSD